MDNIMDCPAKNRFEGLALFDYIMQYWQSFELHPACTFTIRLQQTLTDVLRLGLLLFGPGEGLAQRQESDYLEDNGDHSG